MNRRMIMFPGMLLVALILGIQPGLANISGPVASAAAQSMDPAPAAANAASLSIDTTPYWDGSNSASDFGAPNTATFGQTISMPKDGTLTRFSFFIKISSQAIFRGYVYAWDGSKASGEPLFASGPMSTSQGTAFEAVVFNIPGGITLNAGKQYVLFASTSNDVQPVSTGRWGFVNNVYTVGGLVYQNTGSDASKWTNTNWDTVAEDLAFTATFAEALVTPVALTLPEPDGSGIFTIRLSTQPAAAVTISLASSDPTECTLPASVELTEATWQAGVPVTISAVDDTRADGSQVCTIHLTASSSDSHYNAIDINDVTVTVTDNDYAIFLPFVVNAAKK